MAALDYARVFVTLGMFIIDEFQFHDEEDRPTARTLPAQESPENLICMSMSLLTPFVL